MGNKAFQLRKEGCKVLFAFEEAIGFMMGTAVLDKDGISAGIRLAELAAYLQTQGLTLNDKLNQLYDEYGYHVSLNSYYICHDPVKITKIFDRLRNYNPTQVSGPNYPKEIRNGNYAIVDVRDLTAGYDSEQPYRRPILPISKSSQMITFTFSNGLVATLRTSGTEPKIKYYTELRARPGEKDYDAIKEKLHTMVKSLVEEFLNPVQNELQPKSD
jgi:phosphomannomutase